MKTKWQILVARKQAFLDKAAQVEEELAGLELTPFGSTCTYCMIRLETEADFAQHFLVPDENYPNIGGCPHDPDMQELEKAERDVSVVRGGIGYKGK